VTKRNAFVLAVVVLTLAAEAVPQTSGSARSKAESAAPVLRNTCLITNDVGRLVEFYSRVLGMEAKTSGKDYAEFQTGATVLAIFSVVAQEKYIPGSTQAATNKARFLNLTSPRSTRNTLDCRAL
jgi:hypothetical protein